LKHKEIDFSFWFSNFFKFFNFFVVKDFEAKIFQLKIGKNSFLKLLHLGGIHTSPQVIS